MTPNDRDDNICEICAVLADWGTSVELLVSMKKEDGGSHGFNNVLYLLE